MHSDKIISDFEGLISMLGGTERGRIMRAARWAGLEPNSICMWRERGIPPGYHYRLDREARKRGYEIHPSLFGVEDDDDADPRMDAGTDRVSDGASV